MNCQDSTIFPSRVKMLYTSSLCQALQVAEDLIDVLSNAFPVLPFLPLSFCFFIVEFIT
jgi:hypothetical protein